MDSKPSGETRLIAFALITVAMICVAISDAVGKHLSQDYSIWQILWVRSWVWLTFALFWISRRSSLRLAFHSRVPLVQGLRSLLLVAEIAVFILAFRVLPLGDVTAIVSAAPLVVLALAVVFLKEQVGMHRWIAVAIGLMGMLMVARPGFGHFGWLTLWPLLGALLWGTYQVLVRHVSHHDSEQTTLLWTAVTLFVVTGAIAPFFWRPVPDTMTWALLLIAGLFNALGHFGLVAAMARAEASALQPFSYVQVFSAFIIGYFLFNETPDHWTILGLAAIITGGLYALYRERKLVGKRVSA